MTPEMRRDVVLAHEGQALAMVSSAGRAHASEMAMAVADGLMNALVRMEGPEEAAKFAFALADRVAGGVRAPTNFRIAPPPVPPPIPEPPRAWWRRLRPSPFWRGYAVGFVVGAAVGSAGR